MCYFVLLIRGYLKVLSECQKLTKSDDFKLLPPTPPSYIFRLIFLTVGLVSRYLKTSSLNIKLGRNARIGIDKIKFTNLCSLLKMFINGKQEFEIETFYAFKSVLKRINNQPSMLKN